MQIHIFLQSYRYILLYTIKYYYSVNQYPYTYNKCIICNIPTEQPTAESIIQLIIKLVIRFLYAYMPRLMHRILKYVTFS